MTSSSFQCPVLWCEYSSHERYLGFCSSHYKTHGDPVQVSEATGVPLEQLQRRFSLHARWDDIKKTIDAQDMEIGAVNAMVVSLFADVEALEEKIDFDASQYLRAISHCVKNNNVYGLRALCEPFPDGFPCNLDKDDACVIDHYSNAAVKPRAINPMSLALHEFASRQRSSSAQSEPLKQLFLETPLIGPETVHSATLCEVVYMSDCNPFILAICSRCNVTKKVVDAAKYLNKAPANVSTPERREMLRGVEAIMKEQQKAKRDEAKRKREEEKQEESNESSGKATDVDDSAKGNKRAREEGANVEGSNSVEHLNEDELKFECKNVGKICFCDVAFPNLVDEGYSLDDWTCGAVKRGSNNDIDHSLCEVNTEKIRKQCAALTKQLNTWRPEHDGSSEPWRSFFITNQGKIKFFREFHRYVFFM
jgi:hypothetical protein